MHYYKNLWLPILCCFFFPTLILGQSTLDDQMPIRGLAIKIPQRTGLDKFIKFIKEELAPGKVNTLLLRVDYDYQYQSHPDLANETALTKAEIKRIVAACQQHHIQIIPQINLLGHQSWASKLGNLLKVYPQFDETPHVQIPEDYKWPNDDGLYCKSYCPLHPEVHSVAFDLVDEIIGSV